MATSEEVQAKKDKARELREEVAQLERDRVASEQAQANDLVEQQLDHEIARLEAQKAAILTAANGGTAAPPAPVTKEVGALGESTENGEGEGDAETGDTETGEGEGDTEPSVPQVPESAPGPNDLPRGRFLNR